MPNAIALSRLARSLFHRRLSGEHTEVTPDNLGAYRNLVRAGLMTASDDESSFHLTEEGLARRWEFLPHEDGPSTAAMLLLSRLVGGEQVKVCDETRSAYRELAAAGIMDPCHSFAGGDESAYRFSQEGWNRRHEWLNGLSSPAPSPEESPALLG